MIEKIFMASETNDEQGRKFGPFGSAPEAELQAAKLGWGWVVVYTNAVENGKVVDVTKRYYQPAKFPAPHRTPKELAALRHNLRTPDPKPLTGEETDFFAEYERQMEAASGKSS
jgi:hypothetical protein